MAEAIRISRTVSQAHHELSIDRARSLLKQIDNPVAYAHLSEIINDEEKNR